MADHAAPRTARQPEEDSAPAGQELLAEIAVTLRRMEMLAGHAPETNPLLAAAMLRASELAAAADRAAAGQFAVGRVYAQGWSDCAEALTSGRRHLRVAPAGPGSQPPPRNPAPAPAPSGAPSTRE